MYQALFFTMSIWIHIQPNKYMTAETGNWNFASFSEPQFPHLLNADVKNPALPAPQGNVRAQWDLTAPRNLEKKKRSLYKRKDFIPLSCKCRSSTMWNVHRLGEKKSCGRERNTYSPMQQRVDEVLKYNMEPAKPDIQKHITYDSIYIVLKSILNCGS